MSGVPNQRHFYCSEGVLFSEWFIHERRCKSKCIDGHFLYVCPNKRKAYELRSILNKLYASAMLYELERFRSFCSRRPCYETVFRFAKRLLNESLEVRSDDSHVMSAPIISNGV